MDDAAPAAGAATEKKPRRVLSRIPTSLLVTLLGIALTAWLLPAFTRQWDDRQKAHQLASAVTAQIASLSAHVILQSRRVEHRRPPQIRGVIALPNGTIVTPVSVSRWNTLDDSWLAARVKIESRLRAYFASDVVAAWHRYEQTIRWLLIISLAPVDKFADYGADNAFGIRIERLRNALASIRAYYRGGRADAAELHYADIVNAVLRKQNQLARQILAAHVNGYSTTTRDLLHELVPGR